MLAFATLFTACEKLFPDDPVPATASSSIAAPAAAVPKADDSAPSKYAGNGGVTMEWNFDTAQWVLTDNGTEYDYDEVTSPDPTQILGYDKVNQAYLRWPLKGGLAQESKDNKANWSDYIELKPVADPPAG